MRDLAKSAVGREDLLVPAAVVQAKVDGIAHHVKPDGRVRGAPKDSGVPEKSRTAKPACVAVPGGCGRKRVRPVCDGALSPDSLFARSSQRPSTLPQTALLITHKCGVL